MQRVSAVVRHAVVSELRLHCCRVRMSHDQHARRRVVDFVCVAPWCMRVVSHRVVSCRPHGALGPRSTQMTVREGSAKPLSHPVRAVRVAGETSAVPWLPGAFSAPHVSPPLREFAKS